MKLDWLKEEREGEFLPLLSVSIFVSFVAFYMDDSFVFSNIVASIVTIVGFIVFTYIVLSVLGAIYISVNSKGKRNVLNSIKVGAIASFAALIFFRVVGW